MARDKGIRLSPKHGVNASIAVCFFCGEDNGEIVLPGYLPGDAEAPHRAVWNRNPCDKCREWMKKGVMMISVRDGEKGDNPHRTGRITVVTEDYIRRAIKEPLQSNMLRSRVCFIEDSTWRALGFPEEASAPAPSPNP